MKLSVAFVLAAAAIAPVVALPVSLGATSASKNVQVPQSSPHPKEMAVSATGSAEAHSPPVRRQHQGHTSHNTKGGGHSHNGHNNKAGHAHGHASGAGPHGHGAHGHGKTAGNRNPSHGGHNSHRSNARMHLGGFSSSGTPHFGKGVGHMMQNMAPAPPAAAAPSEET